MREHLSRLIGLIARVRTRLFRPASEQPQQVSAEEFLRHNAADDYASADLAAFRVARQKLALDTNASSPRDLSLDLLVEAVTRFGDPPPRILDFGGGAGHHGYALISHGVKFASYVVVDLPSLVEAARRAGLPSLEFASEMPIGQFDIVFSSGTLQCTADPLKHLSGIR